MTDQVMLSIAGTLAARAADAAAEGARSAATALMGLIRSRLAKDKAAAAALDTARTAPGDPAAVRELAAALERIAAADAGFAARIRELWPEAQAELSADGSGTVNASTGTVGGHLIQARDLHVEGGLLLGDVNHPAPP
jgi:hypothetical protein